MPDGGTGSGRRESDGGGGSSCGGRLGNIAVSREVNNEESEERSNVSRSRRTGRVQWVVCVEEEQSYLPHSIAPLALVGIQCILCQSFQSSYEDYLGTASQFLKVLIVIRTNIAVYNVCMLYCELGNTVYLNNHQPESTNTGINRQLAFHICSNSIISLFHSLLVMK
jgi:hypothetical protein